MVDQGIIKVIVGHGLGGAECIGLREIGIETASTAARPHSINRKYILQKQRPEDSY